MVLLSLSPLNAPTNSSRGWPYQGYLGLTPISTHGTLRTRIGDDRNPLLASKITVAIRCYEARFNKLGSTTATTVLVDRELLLWHPVPGQQYDHIGDLDLPFRFLLPQDLPGPSTCHMPDYRVFWRLEAVIHHVPLVGQGTRQLKAFDLHFIRHDVPPVDLSSSQPTSGALPSCSYNISSPALPVGPEDPVPVSLHLAHQHPNASLVKVQVSLERRIENRDTTSKRSKTDANAPNSPLPTPPSTASSTDGGRDLKGKGKAKENLDGFVKKTTSYFSFSSSSASDTESSSSSATKVNASTIASVEKTKAELVHDGARGWSVDASLAVPNVKPGHWSLGETLSTPLISVRFFICVKATFTIPTSGGSTSSIASTLSGSSSSSTTETITLPPQEIVVVATSSARRAYLHAKVRPAKESSRPIRRSSRRLRRRTSSATIIVDTTSTSKISASSSSSTIGKSTSSKKRHRESDHDRTPLLPSPPRTPAELPQIVLPAAEDTKMDNGEEEEEEKDAPFMLAGDLTFQRVPRRRNVGSSGTSVFSSFSNVSTITPRSPKAQSKALAQQRLAHLSVRPSTAEPHPHPLSPPSSPSASYQRATSVGAVSPTGVLLLAERMGGLMDVSEDGEASPFSFSPPPPPPPPPVNLTPTGHGTDTPPEKRTRRSFLHVGSGLLSRRKS